MDKETLQAISDMMDSKLSLALEPIRTDIAALKQGQAELKESLQLVRISQLKVELEQYPRIAAALDGVVAGIEKNEAQDDRILTLENKTENHNNRIVALEYAK